MKRTSISEMSLKNRKEPRIAMPCVYKRVVSKETAPTQVVVQQQDAETAALATADGAVAEDHVDTMLEAEAEEEDAAQSPLVKTAALLNKLVDKRDLEGTLAKCGELLEDQTGFVSVALSLRSMRTREHRHILGQLLANLLMQGLLNPPRIVEAVNQVLSSKTVRLMLRNYAEVLAPLFTVDDSPISVLGLLSSIDCLTAKQLEKLHDAIGLRLRDLVGPSRARLLLPPAVDWNAYREHQSDHTPTPTEKKRYVKVTARCRETDCTYASTSVNNLRHHLTNIHQMDLPETRVRFSKLQEFAAWKVQLERTSGFQFLRDHLGQYMCSWRAVDPTRRSARTSEQLLHHGLLCTAGMAVKPLKQGGVEVSAFLTHYHQHSLSAYSLADENFLDDDMGQCDLIESGGGDSLHGRVIGGRRRASSQQLPDVVFIDEAAAAEAGLDGFQDGQLQAAVGNGDANSVVADMRRAFAKFETPACYGDMNVVLYKEPQVEIPNSDVWQLDDFALSMASDEQLRRLSEYGGNVLCLSGAEDTPDGAVFHLISMSVVDERLEGWPVVWMLANRCDEQIVAELIKHVGAAMEEKQLVFRAPQVLLTDSSELHRGWCAATDTDSRMIICPWHVQLAWDNALPLIQNEDRVDPVKSQLMQLLRASSTPAAVDDAPAAAARTAQTVRDLTLALLKDPLTLAFGKYFRDNWLQRQQEWAGWHLTQLVEHAELTVRALQRSTEDVSVGRTDHSSMARCVEELLQYLTDRVEDCRIKSDSDTSGEFASTVSQYHAAALALTAANDVPDAPAEDDQVRVVSVDASSTSLAPRVWEVRCTDESQPATVEQWTEGGCPLDEPCRLRCDVCTVCIHEFACSCPATSPCNTICRHIHLVAMFLNPDIRLLHLQQQQKQQEKKHDNPSTSPSASAADIDPVPAEGAVVVDRDADESSSATATKDVASTSSEAEQRVEVANGLLALAVDADHVEENHLAMWRECVEKMRGTIQEQGDVGDVAVVANGDGQTA